MCILFVTSSAEVAHLPGSLSMPDGLRAAIYGFDGGLLGSIEVLGYQLVLRSRGNSSLLSVLRGSPLSGAELRALYR